MRPVLTAGVCIALSGIALLAQTFTGSILGTVRDSSGAVVPDAAITIVNIGTNARAEARSDAAGNYTAPLLPPGAYRLEASAAGFKRFIREGIVLQVQQQARLDITLAVGEVSEQVLVSADAPLLETDTSTLGKVVDTRRILDLPLNTRNVYSLIFSTPGVTGSVGNAYNQMSYSVNGARATMMDTIIDGITASFPTVNGFTGISVFPSVDAIDEFKVMGANYSAEFGRSLGSVLNVAFKSGGNQLHGSVFEFLRNARLDSNDFFANRRGEKLASFRRNQFGGTVTGPIRRDRTFFMAAYEGLRERSLAPTTFSVPTAEERIGDFSQSRVANGGLIRIFDPFGTRPNPSGSGSIRDAFDGNRIPADKLDRVALNAMKYFPLANTPGDAVTRRNNYSLSGARGIDIDQGDVRIDHNFSDRQRFFARYSHRLTTDTPPIFFPNELTIAEGRVVQQNRVRGAVADYTHTLSPRTILSLRLGFARTLFVFDNQGLGFLPSSLGLPAGIDTAADRAMFPRFSATGFVNLGGNDHRWNAFMSHTALASLTQVRGAHTLKVGWEGRLIRVNVWEARSAGTFGFAAGFTQGPNPTAASATAGHPIASLLLGTGTTGNVLIQGWKNVASQSYYHAGYIQDDWRVTSKLTLNLGLRYDLDTPRTERYNRMNYFDPFIPSPLGRGGVVFAGVDGNSRYQYRWDKNNLAPRAGLAYRLGGRTVIRAGYSHVFGPSNQAAQGTVGPFGFRIEYPWVTTLDNITPFNLLRTPYPQGFRPSPGAAEGLLTQAGANLQAPLQDTVTPWAMQWNFNVQRELPAGVLLEVAYVGTRGLQLARVGEGGLSINQLPREALALGNALNDLVPNPYVGRVDSGVLVGPRISRAQSLRPYPQFTDIIPLYNGGASSTYHSLQVTMGKRLARGLQFDGSYTWAKSLDNGMDHQDSYNVYASRSLSGIDLAHRFVIAYIYELPFGRGRRFGGGASGPVQALLGGWQFNGITLFQSGTPLSITANNTAGLFNPRLLANNNGRSGKLSGPVDQRLNRYFDIDVFTQPPPFTLGSLTPTLPDIRNDSVRNFDLSLFKDFRPVERLTVQFRAEFLNAFNTPRFGGPNTGVTSATRGVISAQGNSPRQIQFGLKLYW